MKKILYKTLYKTGGLFSKIHMALYNLAYNIEKRELPVSDLNKVKWLADGKEKILRYHYDLNNDSVVVDVGGYEGDFAAEIFARYRCKVYVFEPVSLYVRGLERRFAKNPEIKLMPEGLGAKDEFLTIYLMDEASSHTRSVSLVKKSAEEKIRIKAVGDFIKEENLRKIDLIKINIEGAEYDLLDNIIANNLHLQMINLQIQFHDFYPDFKNRYNSIRTALDKTHRLTYEYPFVWENWQLK